MKSSVYFYVVKGCTYLHLRNLFLFAVLFFSSSINGQNNFTLQLKATDASSTKTLNENKWLNKNSFNDSLQMIAALKEFRLKAINAGYINCNIDSVICRERTCDAIVYTGNIFQWTTLSSGNVDESFFQGTGFSHRFRNEIFSETQLSALMQGVLKNCENNGYPFAELKLDSVNVNNEKISAQLHLEKNKFITIDSVVQRLPEVVADIYLQSYLSIHEGDVYNEEIISRITNRLKELSFLKEKNPYRIIFTDKATKLELYLEPKRSSQFDGIVGLQPQQDKPGKYNLTGDVHLKLQNSFRRAEVLEFNWKQIPPKSQTLKIHFYYPYLFDTPVGPVFDLQVYKKDTLYIDVMRNIGIQYQFSGNNYINAFVRVKESSLLTTYGLQNITVLPTYADIDNTDYGLHGQYEKLDYRFNPTTGMKYSATVSSGKRKIIRNPKINDAVYDSLLLNSIQYNLQLNTENYFPLYKRNVLLLATQWGLLYSKDNTFENEYFRLGGLQSLRGFDEDALFASSFVIGKLEYRYLLEQNSFFSLYYNQAFYEKKNKYGTIRDWPLGFGAGIAFETRIGILSLNYALGKERSNAIQFKNSKVHFGIINYF